jgi:drug/metabolite transporter (DMT)-like permease
VGLRYTTAIRTGWIIGFVPATTAFAVHVLGYERIRAAGWMGMAIASFGVLVVSGAAPSDLRHARFGDLLQLSSCLTWTAYTILGMGLVGRIGALRATTTPFAVGAALAWVATALSDSTVGAVTPRTITAVVILGLVCNAAAFVLWFQAVQSHGAARVGSTLYFEPFFTLAAAVAVLGEPVGAITTLGGVSVFAGVWLVGLGAERSPGTRRTRRRSQQPVGPGSASDAAW